MSDLLQAAERARAEREARGRAARLRNFKEALAELGLTWSENYVPEFIMVDGVKLKWSSPRPGGQFNPLFRAQYDVKVSSKPIWVEGHYDEFESDYVHEHKVDKSADGLYHLQEKCAVSSLADLSVPLARARAAAQQEARIPPKPYLDGYSVAAFITALTFMPIIATLLAVVGIVRTGPSTRYKGRWFAISALIINIPTSVLVIVARIYG